MTPPAAQFSEDLADDSQFMADNYFVEEYINRNVDNGNLKTLSRQQYLDEGARNQGHGLIEKAL